jgi:hypothetical protein
MLLFFKYIASLLKHKMKIICVFDGKTPEWKLNEHLDRRRDFEIKKQEGRINIYI